MGDFDEAFASRIHMSLHYPPLDLESTNAIFELNLSLMKSRFARQQRQLIINQFELGGFVANYWQRYPNGRWNGRQIRNACQTALALAEFEAQGGSHDTVIDPNAVVELNVRHFQTVADAYLGFMQYMTDIYGVDADERAKERFLRAVPSPVETSNPLINRDIRASVGGSGTRDAQDRRGSLYGGPSMMRSYVQQPELDPNAAYGHESGSVNLPRRGYPAQNPSSQATAPTFNPGQTLAREGQYQPQSWQNAGRGVGLRSSYAPPMSGSEMGMAGHQVTSPPSSMMPPPGAFQSHTQAAQFGNQGGNTHQ